MFRLIFATLIGAALAYFFDPDKGEVRREQARKTMADKSTLAQKKAENYINA